MSTDDEPGWAAPLPEPPRGLDATIQPGIDAGLFPPAAPMPVPPSRPPSPTEQYLRVGPPPAPSQARGGVDLGSLPPPPANARQGAGDLGSLPPPNLAQRRTGADYYPRTPRAPSTPTSWTRPMAYRRSQRPATTTTGVGCGAKIAIALFVLFFFGQSVYQCGTDLLPMDDGSSGSTGVTFSGFGSTDGGNDPNPAFTQIVMGEPTAEGTSLLAVGGVDGGDQSPEAVSRIQMSSDASRALWTTDAVSNGMSGVSAIETSRAGFVTTGQSLRMFDLETGDEIGSTLLPGGIQNMEAAGGVMVAEIDDGSLMAFGSSVESPLWTRGADRPSDVDVVDGVLLGYDDPDARAGGSSSDVATVISRLEPDTGRVLGSVSLECGGSGFSAYDLRESIARVPFTSDFVIEPKSSYGCSARWSQQTNQVRWTAQTRLEDVRRRSMGPPLVGSSYLAMSSYEGHVVLMDLGDGSGSSISPPAGWAMWPRVVVGEVVVVDAVKLGTPNVGAIMAFDTSDGRQLWSMRLPVGILSSQVRNEEVDGTWLGEGEERFVATLAGGGEELRLFTVDENDPGALVWWAIDPRTGTMTEVARPSVQPFTIDEVQVKAISTDQATLLLEQAIVVVPEAETSEILSYP